MKEPTPVIVPVAPLKVRTPLFVIVTLPVELLRTMPDPAVFDVTPVLVSVMLLGLLEEETARPDPAKKLNVVLGIPLIVTIPPPTGVEVAMIFPFPSVARKVFVIPVRIVELLNVAVELKIAPLPNV